MWGFFVLINLRSLRVSAQHDFDSLNEKTLKH